MKKIAIFLVIYFYVPQALALECKHELKQEEAASAVAAFRDKTPNAPKQLSGSVITFKKNPFSCHYLYTDTVPSLASHGAVTFIINSNKQVVHVRSPFPIKGLVCPPMELSKDDLLLKVDELRKNDSNMKFPPRPERSTFKVIKFPCVYVFEERFAVKNKYSDNSFYFDFNGELFDFYPKASR